MNEYRYRYYNRRPDGAEIEDCVCRAISTATGLKYEAIENLLNLTGDKFNCEALCLPCYENLLTRLFCYEPHYCSAGETVGDIANRYSDRKVIIRIEGHVTASMYGVISDIWNCTEKLADVFWVIE